MRLLVAALIFFLALGADYYDILGLEKTANMGDIKRAYRKMALKWHPDKNPDNRKEAEERFREVAEAYEVLSDPEKRKRYDGGGGGTGGAHEEWAHGHNFNFQFKSAKDLFKEMFGTDDPFADFHKFFDEVEDNGFASEGFPGMGDMGFDFGGFNFDFDFGGGGGGGAVHTSFSTVTTTTSYGGTTTSSSSSRTVSGGGGRSERVETVIENGKRVTRRVVTEADGTTKAYIESADGAGNVQRKVGRGRADVAEL